MARLERGPQLSRIVAENPEERALLAEALDRGGELPLREALFPVSAEALGVPLELDPLEAESLRREFEAAARAHLRALERRSRFRSI